MKKLCALLSVLVVLAACRKSEIKPADLPVGNGKFSNPVININVHDLSPRSPASLKEAINSGKQSSSEIYRDSAWASGFGKTLFIETDEIALMKNSSYEKFIYGGSLLKGNTIADMNFKPISEFQSSVKPITVSVSFQAKRVSGVINNVSLSGTRNFINDLLIQNDISDQIAGFSYNLEQFSAYDELKLAFGSNVKTSSLFSSSSGSTSETSVKISKRTGIYAKFVQKNFTMDLDIPAGGRLMNESVDMNVINQQFPTYVSSVTYGRMGVMAIESDYNYEETNNAYNTAFKALFVKGSRSTTEYEKKVIGESTMKIYIIGADGNGAVQTVNGYDAFVQFVASSGKFSATEPGTPIYFSLSYLADHSVVKTRFRVNLETDPIYARVEYENLRQENPKYDVGYDINTRADVYLRFYSDMTGTHPTIPPPFVKFQHQKLASYSNYDDDGSGGANSYNHETRDSAVVNNSFKDTKILIGKDVYLKTYSYRQYSYTESGGIVHYSTSTQDAAIDYSLKNGNYYKVLATKTR